MEHRKSPLFWVGIGLIALSALLIIFDLIPGWGENLAPATIFFSLTTALIFIYFTNPWPWKGWLFIPIFGFASFGLVFLFNALTHDWAAWAYAWLFCIAALGAGLALAAYTTRQNGILIHTGWWVAIGCGILFGLFGAIANGPFMRFFAILLLALLGVGLLIWLRQGRPHLPAMFPPAPQSPETAAPRQVVEVDAPANQALVEPLSKRELEVLAWIDQGLSNAEIAERLVVAQSTVKTHINNIFAKLGAQSRTQALRRAKDLGLL